MSLLNDLRRLPRVFIREWEYWRRPLKGCCLEPTYRCNLRCRMCGTRLLSRPADKDQELTQAEMLKIVDELAEMKAAWLQLIGGEPFLRPDDMLALTARANQVGIETTIVTNGALIDEGLAREVVRVGLPKMVFSVDGFGQVHDSVRGVRGAFERAQRGMRLVLEERQRRNARKPLVEIQSTLCRLNYHQVEALLRFKAEMRADEIVFLYLSEIPRERLKATQLGGQALCSERWAPVAESLLFTPREVSEFRQLLKGMGQSEPIRLLRALGDDAFLNCAYPTRRCYFMRTTLIINPFGEAYPCPHIDRFITGNVREIGVRGVWQNERHRRVIAGLGRRMYPVCSSCCVFALNLTPLQAARLALWGRL